MIVNLRDLFAFLVLMAIIITPFNGVFEAYNAVFGKIESQATSVAPIYIKALKDVIFGLCIIIGIIKIANYKAGIGFFLALLCFFCIELLVITNSADNSYLYFLAGYRWSAAILLVFLSASLVDKEMFYSSSNLLIKIFYLQLLLQVIQFFFWQNSWFGQNSFGFALRCPGFFFLPNSAGFFTVLTLYYALFFSCFSNRKKFFVIFLTLISGYLTASGTALIAWFALCLLWTIPRRNLILGIIPILILTVIVFLSLGTITGRGPTYLQNSLGVRVEVFNELLAYSTIISSKFGFGTATAYMLKLDAINTDSTFGGLLANLGLIGLMFALIVLLYLSVKGWLLASKTTLSLVLVLVVYMGTTSVPEAFPMNFLLAITFGYLLKNKFLEPEFNVRKQNGI